MKCRYGDNCKFGGEVEKKDAHKDGSAYYHKECWDEKICKQEIEAFYMGNMRPTTLQILRKAVKQLLSKDIEARYILHIIKYIHSNNKPLNNPFGIASYCLEGRNIDAWNKMKINKKFKEMDKEIEKIEKEDVVKFTYKLSKKRITDII